jgi:hypothetical protein
MKKIGMLSRRKFLCGVSLTAMMLVITLADAGYHHGSATALGNVSTGPSGSLLGAFNNFARNLQNLASTQTGFPTALDVNQYPNNYASTPAGSLTAPISTVFQLPSDITTSTQMVVRWTGTAGGGGFGMNIGSPGFTIVSDPGNCANVAHLGFALVLTGISGRVVFTFGQVTGFQTSGCPFAWNSGSTYSGFGGLIICRLSDEATVLAEAGPSDVWNANWIAVYKACNPKIIRIMALVDPNDNNNFPQTKYRKAWQTAAGYQTNNWVPNTWAGALTGTTNYTASNTPTDFTTVTNPYGLTVPAHGTVIQGYPLNAASATTTSTLTVGGVGPIPIGSLGGSFPQIAIAGTVVTTDNIQLSFTGAYLNGGSAVVLNVTTLGTTTTTAAAAVAAAINANTTLTSAGMTATASANAVNLLMVFPKGYVAIAATVTAGSETVTTGLSLGQSNALEANSSVTLFYDIYYHMWMYSFSAASDPDGLHSFLPYEVLVGLANRVNAHLWYNFPGHYDNASITATTAYAAVALNPQLNFYCEHHNEVWNVAAAFQYTFYAVTAGNMLGAPDFVSGYSTWYGLKVAQMSTLAVAAWAGAGQSRSRLKIVLACPSQADGGAAGDAGNIRLNGQYLTTGNAVYNTIIGTSYNASPNRPIDKSDVLSYATYWSGSQSVGPTDAGYTAAMTACGPDTLALGGTPPKSGLLGAASDYASGNATQMSNAIDYIIWDWQEGQRMTRTVTAISGANITCNVTGFVVGAKVSFSILNGGTLPPELPILSNSQTANYWVVSVVGLVIQVSATNGGPPIICSTGITGAVNFGYSDFGNTQSNFFNNVYPAYEAAITAQCSDAQRAGIGLAPITVECYEGAMEAIYPAVSTLTTLGVANPSTYGGPTGEIANLINAAKNDPRFKTSCLAQFSGFKSFPHSVTPSWFVVDGGSQWSLIPSLTIVGAVPYQSYYAVRDF